MNKRLSAYKKQGSSKKWLYLALIALLLTCCGLYFYFSHTATPSSNSENTTESQEKEAKQAAEDTKKQTIEANSSSSSKPGEEDSNPVQDVSISLTYSNQNDTTLTLRTLINKVVTSGSCTIILSQGSKTVSKTADIQALSNSSTCKGFDIPLSELGLGTWKLDLSFSSGSYSGSSTQQVEVR